MKFDELDAQMRIYEEYNDHCVLPGMYMVARLDGKGFTKWTKECNFTKPFDETFDDHMSESVKALMEQSGFEFLLGYHQSDEISLLFTQDEGTFNRKTRKLNSVLASVMTGVFNTEYNPHTDRRESTEWMGGVAHFDCRISELPNLELVLDYFNWRQADCLRNCLNSTCHWSLIQEGKLSAKKASRELEGKTKAQKHELLFKEFNINFDSLPVWQKRGTFLYWENYIKEGFNPINQTTTEASRRRVKVDKNTPKDFVANLLFPEEP